MADILDQLQINHTFWYQFGLFAAFFFVLSQLYLKPFQKLIEKRNHKLSHDTKDAADLMKSVDAKLTAYEQELSRLRHESRMSFEQAVSEVRAKEDSTIAVFRDELKKDYLKVQQQFAEEKVKMEAELKSHVNELADAVAAKAMGK